MRRGAIAAMVFVAAVNAIVLAGVARNRSAAESVLEMTERELPLAGSSRENSGVSFRIELNREWDRPLEWLDRKKMTELGFDLSDWKPERKDAVGTRKILPRRVYVVLEYQGEAWKRWDERMQREIEKAAQKRQELKEGENKEPDQKVTNRERRRSHASRLFPVDVGRDPEALRTRYPDGSRYIVTPAVVSVSLRYDRLLEKKTTEVCGSISEILCDQVTVPLNMQGQVADFAHKPEASSLDIYSGDRINAKAPRYSAVVRFGKRYEPWVESVTRVNAGKESE